MKNIWEAVELICVFTFIIACHSVQQNSKTLLPDFDKQGHRGCRGLMPENTIPAMLHAIDLGVTTLEMDAVITADQQVILSHEPFFNHEISTKPDGTAITEKEEKSFNIFRMNFAKTQRFDVGMKPHPRFPDQQKIRTSKPLLEQLIDSVEAYVKAENKTHPFYNIETKSHPLTDNIFHPTPEQFVDLLMRSIRKKRIEDRVIIQSFDFRTLRIMNKKYPAIRTAALIEDYDKSPFEQQLKNLGFIPTIYSPHYSLVDKELVNACHSRDIKLIPWTVNDSTTISELKKLGVDGIITDYPNLF